MNQYYEPYLAHWRPKGSKNGMHLFGIAQNPSKYANGEQTAGLMSEWNRRQRRIGEWDAWANNVNVYKDWRKKGYNSDMFANGKEPILVNDKPRYMDESEYLKLWDKRQKDATRRANIHRAKSNQIIDTLGEQAMGSLYKTPLKHLYRTYFKTAAKVYGAGGFKNYIKQSAGQVLKNIGGMARKFKNFITGKKETWNDETVKEWGLNPITLREDRKAARRNKKLARTAINNSQSRWQNMTKYNQQDQRAKRASKIYRTNSKYLPTAVV